MQLSFKLTSVGKEHTKASSHVNILDSNIDLSTVDFYKSVVESHVMLCFVTENHLLYRHIYVPHSVSSMKYPFLAILWK